MALGETIVRMGLGVGVIVLIAWVAFSVVVIAGAVVTIGGPPLVWLLSVLFVLLGAMIVIGIVRSYTDESTVPRGT